MGNAQDLDKTLIEQGYTKVEMKKILYLTILVICSIQLVAQQWTLHEGGNNSDQGTSIFADKNGHIYATGFFSSSATFGSTTLTSVGSYDGYLIKYDTSGSCIWAKSFGGIGSDYPGVIKVDNTDNIIIAGAFRNSNVITFDSISIATNNNSDNYFVVKFN